MFSVKTLNELIAERDVWYERVGRAIRDMRTEVRMTQRELSAVSGVTQAQISRIEQGIGGVSTTVLTKLREALLQEYQQQRSGVV